MLPTPCTAHVSFDTIYEPSEDSYLFLDTLSSASESAWLSARFNPSSPSADKPPTTSPSPSPLVVEVGTGSGVVLGFVAANSQQIFRRRDILTLGTDVNRNACIATRETAQKAIRERQYDVTTPSNKSNNSNNSKNDNPTPSSPSPKTAYISSIMSDLATPLRPHAVDVLLFNPPYVPTEDLPHIPSATEQDSEDTEGASRSAKFERDSYFLSLTYAGGRDGMETTDRLLDAIPGILDPDRGVAYVLLCAQNRPGEVQERIRGWGDGWNAVFVGNSGVQAGWEKLVIVRIWRDV